uniref:Uncharacterized protein n=1 Tax=Anopheles culicifacies TaxID=139723 RepID=A0A182LX19_9DIPT
MGIVYRGRKRNQLLKMVMMSGQKEMGDECTKEKRIQSGFFHVKLYVPAEGKPPSTRPESDFTLDVPRAEQLRLKMKKEKQFRSRCRWFFYFLSVVFFLLSVMVVSLILTRGKRMFGSMI